MPINDSGWVELDAAQPPTPSARGIIKQFWDEMGNVVPNPDPNKLFGGLFDAKPGHLVDEAINAAGNAFTGGFAKKIDDTQAKVEALTDAVKAKADQEAAQASHHITQIIDLGERKIATNAKPILGALDGITAGVKSITSLDDATLVAIMTSIPWALEFLQTERIGQTNKAIGSMTDAMLASPSLIVKGVSDSLGQLGRGIIEAMMAMLAKIEALILDPLAALLAAILASVTGLPKRIADALIDKLLEDDGTVKALT